MAIFHIQLSSAQGDADSDNDESINSIDSSSINSINSINSNSNSNGHSRTADGFREEIQELNDMVDPPHLKGMNQPKRTFSNESEGAASLDEDELFDEPSTEERVSKPLLKAALKAKEQLEAKQGKQQHEGETATAAGKEPESPDCREDNTSDGDEDIQGSGHNDSVDVHEDREARAKDDSKEKKGKGKKKDKRKEKKGKSKKKDKRNKSSKSHRTGKTDSRTTAASAKKSDRGRKKESSNRPSSSLASLDEDSVHEHQLPKKYSTANTSTSAAQPEPPEKPSSLSLLLNSIEQTHLMPRSNATVGEYSAGSYISDTGWSDGTSSSYDSDDSSSSSNDGDDSSSGDADESNNNKDNQCMQKSSDGHLSVSPVSKKPSSLRIVSGLFRRKKKPEKIPLDDGAGGSWEEKGSSAAMAGDGNDAEKKDSSSSELPFVGLHKDALEEDVDNMDENVKKEEKKGKNKKKEKEGIKGKDEKELTDEVEPKTTSAGLANSNRQDATSAAYVSSDDESVDWEDDAITGGDHKKQNATKDSQKPKRKKKKRTSETSETKKESGSSGNRPQKKGDRVIPGRSKSANLKKVKKSGGSEVEKSPTSKSKPGLSKKKKETFSRRHSTN